MATPITPTRDLTPEEWDSFMERVEASSERHVTNDELLRMERAYEAVFKVDSPYEEKRPSSNSHKLDC